MIDHLNPIFFVVYCLPTTQATAFRLHDSSHKIFLLLRPHRKCGNDSREESIMKSTDKTKDRFPTIVIVARHGERLDYVQAAQGQNFVATAKRPWDPPLTEHGKEQAHKLGRQIAKECQRLGIAPLQAIFSSPFLRVRQTAAFARQGYHQEQQSTSVSAVKNERQPDNYVVPLVQVEMGLSESINASWYRSWALRGSDGTWGYTPKNKNDLTDPATFHPMSRQPVQAILDWKKTVMLVDNNEFSQEHENDDACQYYDLEYESQTKITLPYCFGSDPPLLESAEDQMSRMQATIEKVHVPGQTVLLVSHGGPVTHLFEALTGKHWKQHGVSTYCCYSIYQQKSIDATTTWEPLVVNESKFLHEELLKEVHV